MSEMLLCVLCLIVCSVVESTSLMRRIRERQSADIALNKGLELQSQQWIQVPQPIQDVLMSIDDKLRSLDTFSYTLKLARLDFSLDQLVRRMENIETKFGRLDTKFDVRMEKIEEIVISKDIKEEFSNEYLSRRMENLNEKINNKAAYLDAKLDMKLERILGKLELMERELHNVADDVLERLIKSEEKFNTFETEMLKKANMNDEIKQNVKNLHQLVKEDITNQLTTTSGDLSTKVSELQLSVQTTANTTNRMLRLVQTSLVERTNLPMLDLPVSNDNLTVIPNQVRNLRSSGCNDLIMTALAEMKNLTSISEKSMQANEERSKKLDSDMQLYTKKMVNGIQDLWQVSDKLQMDLSNSIEQGNRTREILYQEIRLLQQHMEPLPRLETKIKRIGDDIDTKIGVLSSTTDSSLATLLVSQNSFIASCHRIQDEETHVYDILQQIVYEMRNRSVEANRRVNSELNQQSLRANASLSRILGAVFETGNSTVASIQNYIRRHKHKDFPTSTNEVTCKVMERVCKTASRGLSKSSEMMLDLEEFPEDDEKPHPRHEKSTTGNQELDNKNYDFLDYPLDNEADYQE